jgi:hypothetical protein
VLGLILSLLLVFSAIGAETIKIGALYNLTGGMSSIDAPALNGAKLQAKLIKGVSILSVHDGNYKVEEVWFPQQ